MNQETGHTGNAQGGLYADGGSIEIGTQVRMKGQMQAMTVTRKRSDGYVMAGWFTHTGEYREEAFHRDVLVVSPTRYQTPGGIALRGQNAGQSEAPSAGRGEDAPNPAPQTATNVAAMNRIDRETAEQSRAEQMAKERPPADVGFGRRPDS